MRLAQISERAAELSDKYQVPEHLSNASRKLGEVSEKVYRQMRVAGAATGRGAAAAYRSALEHPRASIAAIMLAAALVGGALWWMFGRERKPLQRRRRVAHVRAGSERRRSHARSAARSAA